MMRDVRHEQLEISWKRAAITNEFGFGFEKKLKDEIQERNSGLQNQDAYVEETGWSIRSWNTAFPRSWMMLLLVDVGLFPVKAQHCQGKRKEEITSDGFLAHRSVLVMEPMKLKRYKEGKL
ncbi:hypothetical protein C5167_043646 [Papaver somniferum]|uniref:Uncharacterized protein n=1 Tax=Papaver somniferum TaxID=3469 RepID=A0A4Y7L7Z1_PAPSO|nr:hypothetical protein C5167_043646 [Papaver somniferum]